MVLVWPKNSTLFQMKIPETPSANRCVEALLVSEASRSSWLALRSGGVPGDLLPYSNRLQERVATLGPMAGEDCFGSMSVGALGSRWQHRCRWSCIVLKGVGRYWLAPVAVMGSERAQWKDQNRFLYRLAEWEQLQGELQEQACLARSHRRSKRLADGEGLDFRLCWHWQKGFALGAASAWHFPERFCRHC